MTKELRGYPSWSPDGQRIVYMGYDDASNAQVLFIMNADGSGQYPITFRDGYD